MLWWLISLPGMMGIPAVLPDASEDWIKVSDLFPLTL
jgi:hypothetical protein